MTLTASVLLDEGTALLALSGELDLAGFDGVQSQVDAVLADGVTRVVVDLSALVFCDSAGVGTLLRTHRRVTTAGGSCVVAGARGQVAKLLHLLAMDKVLVLREDVGQALTAVRA